MSLELPKTEQEMDDAFPFPQYRDLYDGKTQRDVIDAIESKFRNGKKTIFLDAPTGTGKSAINTTLCNLAEDAFYTTPQKSLRSQLESDDVLRSNYSVLKARADYTCGATGKNCKDCDINLAKSQSCLEQDDCTYWNSKIEAMADNTSVVTFAYLIIDSNMPPDKDGTKISFEDRELLVLDEGQALEGQIASLFAGIEVSAEELPDSVFRTVTSLIPPDAETHEDIIDVIEQLKISAENFIDRERSKPETPRRNMELEKCRSVLSKVEWFLSDVEHGNPWVVDVDENLRDRSYEMFVRPIDIGGFLKRNVWRRTDKRIISTATMPFRDDIRQWCWRLGLDHRKAAKISVGMPFPKENRPIHTGRMVGNMSNGGMNQHWDAVVSETDDIAGCHEGQKGLVHSVSYIRAQRFMDSINSSTPNLQNNTLMQKKRDDPAETIRKWQEADEDILISPSMTEGVDLHDDMCRWMVLPKIPNPDAGDSRIEYLLENRPQTGWPYYWAESMNGIIQSAGRGVRHREDYCDVYILDSAFNDLISKRVTPPEWFKEAIVE